MDQTASWMIDQKEIFGERKKRLPHSGIYSTLFNNVRKYLYEMELFQE